MAVRRSDRSRDDDDPFAAAGPAAVDGENGFGVVIITSRSSYSSTRRVGPSTEAFNYLIVAAKSRID